MTLVEYLERHNLSQGRFAQLVEVNQSTVSKWISGDVVPRPSTMRRIEKLTAGEVPATVWVSGPPHHAGAAPGRRRAAITTQPKGAPSVV